MFALRFFTIDLTIYNWTINLSTSNFNILKFCEVQKINVEIFKSLLGNPDISNWERATKSALPWDQLHVNY